MARFGEDYRQGLGAARSGAVESVMARITWNTKRRKNMDRKEKIKIVVEEFLNKNYGETIEHFRLAALVEEGVNSWEYRYIISKASKMLLECGRAIENVKGVGYRVIYPDDYNGKTASLVRSGVNRINKGVKVLQSAPVKDMTQEGVQAYNAIYDRMKILQASVNGAGVEVSMLGAKRENPLKQMAERNQNVNVLSNM